jgi:hypothetical protein
VELQGSLGGTHHLTLLDGEMVIDKLPSGEFKRRYLVYDLIMLNQKSLAKVPLGSVISTRLNRKDLLILDGKHSSAGDILLETLLRSCVIFCSLHFMRGGR